MRRHGTGKSQKPKLPKTKLGLHDLDHSKSAVLDSLRSRESKRGYRSGFEERALGANTREVRAPTIVPGNSGRSSPQFLFKGEWVPFRCGLAVAVSFCTRRESQRRCINMAASQAHA
jgi:hypothetical protein